MNIIIPPLHYSISLVQYLRKISEINDSKRKNFKGKFNNSLYSNGRDMNQSLFTMNAISRLE